MQSMKRKCPNCKKNAEHIYKLIFSSFNVRCENCGSLVGLHWLLNVLFYFVAFLLCLFSTILVINQFGIGFRTGLLIVLIWLVVGILRDALVPLEIKASSLD